ncbi:MAG TPA: hypothetical protein VFU28_17290 [Vicinamibacterales bacterium]|nr:hypothetical protein [Vicinamibacterales bacterium]
MNSLAEQYVRLVLAVGQHDADYVDAYYGPPEWRKEAAARKLPLTEIASRAAALSRDLAAASQTPASDEMAQLRRHYLTRQLDALRARVSMLTGTKLRFDEESKALYDATAPTHTEADFAGVLAQLGSKLPGNGSLIDRYDAFRSRFVIPRERLDAVFKAAIDGCRSRTLQHITLPPGESFTVEYVTGKSWSGYNWYQGNYRSLIQVNTDLPIYVDRAIDLACHEGYPGHHVYNVLLEQNLLRDRGWIEFSVYPLFSPQSLIAEGTANYGIEVAFPPAERLQFERRVLFPAAGLNPENAAQYYDVMALVDKLSYAGNEAARRYLDGKIDAKAAADWLEKYGLYSRLRAEQRVRFVDQYRSYVINYNLGKDMVAAYIESRGPDRWTEFARLISSPRLPSSLVSPDFQRPTSK